MLPSQAACILHLSVSHRPLALRPEASHAKLLQQLPQWVGIGVNALSETLLQICMGHCAAGLQGIASLSSEGFLQHHSPC